MKRRTDITTERVVELYVKDGLSILDISHKLKCSYELVRSRLKKSGTKIMGKERALARNAKRRAEIASVPKGSLIEKIKIMYEAGKSAEYISKLVPLSPPTIIRHLKIAGVTTRDRARSAALRGKRCKKRVQNKTTARICSCCGSQPVPKKPVKGVQLTRLCASCFFNAESDPEAFVQGKASQARLLL